MDCVSVDIETTGLKSDQGYLLGCAFKPLGKPAYWVGLDKHVLYHRPIKPRDAFRIDMNLAAAIRDELAKYDIWLTWNGKKFDIPFIDDRLILSGAGGQHPRRRHIDVMYQARQFKACFSSSRLKWIQDVLQLRFSKTDLKNSEWQCARQEAVLTHFGHYYRYIKTHGLRDVLVLEEVYKKFKPRVQSIPWC